MIMYFIIGAIVVRLFNHFTNDSPFDEDTFLIGILFSPILAVLLFFEFATTFLKWIAVKKIKKSS